MDSKQTNNFFEKCEKEWNNMAEIGSTVLPGDIVQELKQSEVSGKTILGPGLRKDSNTHTGEDSIVVCKPGILRHKHPNVYWIDSHQKRVKHC